MVYALLNDASIFSMRACLKQAVFASQLNTSQLNNGKHAMLFVTYLSASTERQSQGKLG